MYRLMTLFFVLWMVGCAPSWFTAGEGGLHGGGQDDVTVHMPFASGYTSQCVQGTDGSYSHRYNSTRYDIDLDTPNNRRDPVFAPASGTVFVHDDGATRGFGLHVNLELADGSFIVMGHLDEVLVGSGEEVAVGQLIGVEGTTGHSTGDHVHFGRHVGDAGSPAGSSTSVVGLRMTARNVSSGVSGSFPLSQMLCGIPGGHHFRSQLPVGSWHPNGTLVKSFARPEVYLLKGGRKHHVANEAVFYGHRWLFTDVSVVTDEELACYGNGEAIDDAWRVSMRYESGRLWLLDGPAGAVGATRYRMSPNTWRAVAKSWGLPSEGDVSQFAQVSGDASLMGWVSGGDARFREGTILKERGRSDVYVVTDGVASPIANWDAYLLLDFGERFILEVEPGMVQAVQGRVGSCATGVGCVTVDRVKTCGGGFIVAGNDSDTDEGTDTGGADVDSDTETDEDAEPDTDTDGDIEPDTDASASWWYFDGDSDGYGREQGAVFAIERPSSAFVPVAGDCDDGWSSINPGANELCDGFDNNCNGIADEGLAYSWWYEDGDGDGFGDVNSEEYACAKPAENFVENGDDFCDDDRDAVTLEECFPPVLYVWYLDADGDGFGRNAGSVTSENAPSSGYVSVAGDCDDLMATVYPGANELCDTVDNDCDGSVDEGGVCEECLCACPCE